MCWLIICPACGKPLKLSESDNSNHEYGLVIDDHICGCCGVDMHVALKQLYDEMRKSRADNDTK